MTTKTQAIHNLVRALGADDAKYTDEGTVAAAIQDLADAVEDGAISAGGGSSMATLTIESYDSDTGAGVVTGIKSLIPTPPTAELAYDSERVIMPLLKSISTLTDTTVGYNVERVAEVSLSFSSEGNSWFMEVYFEGDDVIRLQGDTSDDTLVLDMESGTATFTGSGDTPTSD